MRGKYLDKLPASPVLMQEHSAGYQLSRSAGFEPPARTCGQNARMTYSQGGDWRAARTRLFGLEHVDPTNSSCQTGATEIYVFRRLVHGSDATTAYWGLAASGTLYCGGDLQNIPRYYLFRGGFCLSFRVEISTAFLCSKPKKKPPLPALIRTSRRHQRKPKIQRRPDR